LTVSDIGENIKFFITTAFDSCACTAEKSADAAMNIATPAETTMARRRVVVGMIWVLVDSTV
jgi:hypothetical protein